MICPNCFSQSFDGVRCLDCSYEMKDEKCIEDMKLFHVLKNRYVIGRSLGAGGYGITYAAFDRVGGSKVCIKEYFPSGLAVRMPDGVSVQSTRQNRTEEFAGGIERFVEEAQIISELNSISGVVRVTDSFRENGTAYYVMEFLDGVTLKKLVPEHGLDLKVACGVIIRAGRTLDRIHKEKGYLHRDISPENIMILPSGRVVIIDFGCARSYFMSTGFAPALKHGFAPIEQYSSTDIQGPYTDLYSLASTFYYILTGKMIPRATDRLTGEEYEPLAVLRPDIDTKISDIVDKALKLQPAERTQTVGEFLDELTAVIRTLHHDDGLIPVSVSIDGAVQQQYKIEENKEITVGRSSQCDIVFPNCENVSKLHCKLMFDSEKKQFCIEDCSTNGTYINYVKLEKGKKYDAGKQDLIILANTRFRLILGE